VFGDLLPLQSAWTLWRIPSRAAAFGVVIAAIACALPIATALPDQYVFDTFGSEFGLPQTNVTAVCQTRDGYLWVGTEGGLGRFDGVRFVAFKRSNTPAFVPNQSIRRLFEDAAGALWIGTESGVVRYREGKFEPAGLAGMIITGMAQDRTGRMWFGTEGHGVCTIDRGEVHSFAGDPAMLGANVRTVFVDSTNRVWIGFAHAAGALCFENGRFRYQAVGGAESRETFAIAEWPRGTLWFGTGRGLYRLADGGTVRVDRKNDLSNPQITDLQPAREGGLWVVAGSVMRLTDPESFGYAPVAQLPVSAPRSVIEDREGNLWVCAQFDGLVRARRTFYQLLNGTDGLPGNVVKAVSVDRAGNRWLAIQSHGVVRVAPDGAVTVLDREQGMPSQDPLSVCAADDGTVWAAFSTGLAAWRGTRTEVYPQYRSVRILFEDRAGGLWFGNDEALWLRRDGAIARVALGRAPSVVNAIGEGPDGAVYVAASSGGLFRVKSGTATCLGDGNGTLSGSVRALYVDGDGRIWIGSKGRGLGVWVDGRWFNPDALADAVTDHVSAIAEDTHGQLWLGTPSGIVWGPKQELLAAARGERPVPRLRLAGTEDGFRVTAASSHSQPTVARNGRTLVFATRRGVLAIDPDDVPRNQVPPPVNIERIVVDGRAVPLAGRLELAPDVRQLAIEYTALSFVSSARAAFRYKLEGYDRDWVEAGTRRLASYANLPAGEYVFHVIACNSDGQWNLIGASVRIRQIPHFYHTGWFAALVAVLVVASGLGAVRWSRRRLERELERMEQKQMLERERRRIARHLHDDLGASLTEIGLFAEAARRRALQPDATDDLLQLSSRVRGVVGSLDAIVWATNPANDSLDHVATYICEYFQSLFSRSTIRCRVDVGGDMPAYPLTPEQRTDLFLTAKEAMNNILKHSGAASAWLRMKMEAGRFELTLEDDGCGFDRATAAAGRNGVGNMRSRMEEIGGSFAIEPRPGGGARVAIALSFAGKSPRAARADATAPDAGRDRPTQS
jgi:signal transduction histidine kinase/ligand-binding sensor domain-containing protein